MIPAAFDYVAPTSVADALQALADGGEDAKVLGGGQSLLPVLRMRLGDPSVLVDLGRIEGLKGVTEDGDHIVIGAMTAYADVLANELVRDHATVLHKAIVEVADPQIRHRGTLGGGLVHADPAGDVAAPILALEADLVITGSGGERTVAAADFFTGLFETAVGDGELLTSIRIPKHTGWGGHYEKFVRVVHQWSIIAVAANVRVEGGSITEARIGLTNMGLTGLRAPSVEQALVGCAVNEEAIAAACATSADGTEPPSDLNGSADYRRALAPVLTRRAVLAAAGG